MKAMLRSFRAAALLLGTAAVSVPVLAAPTSTAPVAVIAAEPASATIQLAAIGDPPRRRGRRAPGKDKPYQPLAKDPQGESASAHKDYLKRYGF